MLESDNYSPKEAKQLHEQVADSRFTNLHKSDLYNIFRLLIAYLPDLSWVVDLGNALAARQGHLLWCHKKPLSSSQTFAETTATTGCLSLQKPAETRASRRVRRMTTSLDANRIHRDRRHDAANLTGNFWFKIKKLPLTRMVSTIFWKWSLRSAA